MRPGRALAALVALAALATGGCGGPEPAAPPPAPAATSAAPAPARDGAACEAQARDAAAIRLVAAEMAKGPVLPAGVALFLVAPRMQAAGGGIADPALAAAMAELVSAIDELDARGRELLPPGGNPARDAVPLDPARLLAAVAAVEAACAAQG